MDRSNTGSRPPQGDAAIRTSLEIIGSIKPNMDPSEQMMLLRKCIACINMWYPISKLGVKRMEEHYRERIGKFFDQNAVIEYGSSRHTRAIPLIGDFKDSQIGIYVRKNPYSRHSYVTGYIGIFPFLAEDMSLLMFRCDSEQTDCIELAHKVELFEANDKFLQDLMSMDEGFCTKGCKDIVINAIRHLRSTLYHAKDAAQKKANSIGYGENAFSLIYDSLAQAIAKSQEAETNV